MYRFAVCALNGLEAYEGYAFQEFSDFSEFAVPEAPGGTEVAPDTPEDAPNAVAGDASVTLDWTFSGEAGTANGVPVSIIEYVIYYRVSGVGSYEELARYNTTSTIGGIVLETGLTNDTAYQFKYSVVNGNTTTNESGQSPAVSATPTAPAPGVLPPGQPQNLNLTYDPEGYPGGGPRWIITWEAGGGEVNYYQVVVTAKNQDGTASGGFAYYFYVEYPFTERVLPAGPGEAYEFGIFKFTITSVGNGTSEPAIYITP